MLSQYVSVSEAARVLGVSRRTVDRRIASGKLRTVDQDGTRLVVLEDTPVPAMSATPTETAMSELVAMRARLQAVEEERDHLRQTVDKLTGTVDRLTISMAQLSGTIVEQQALDTGQDTPDTPRPAQRAWWRFWVR
jgi:excisionase family DNA binding protein